MDFHRRLIRLAATIGLLGLFCWSLAESIRSPCPRAIRTNTNYQYRGQLHFICLQIEPNSKPRLDVIQWSNSQVIWYDYIDETETNQLASFVDNEGTLRILLAVPKKINGTTMYSIDSSGRGLNERHTVNTQYVSHLAIWRLDLNWEWHLAIANQPELDHLAGAPNQYNSKRLPQQPLPQPGPIITLHSWRHTYFDRYQVIELPYDGRINKLEPMHINGQEFLIVAMESNAGENGRHLLPTNTLIYKLDFGDGSLRWVNYQTLNTKLALDASSFLITHRGSLQVDYYIALVGQLEKETNYENQAGPSAQEQHGLIIYKYFGDKFFKTNSIAVPGAIKMDTITYGQGDSHVVIALMSGWPNQQISLFLFDGLTLKPIPSPRFHSAPRVNMGPAPSMRYRRTMDRNSLQLFRVPPNSSDDTSFKRDLDAVSQNSGLPALVFSSIDSEDSASDSTSSPTGLGNTGQDTLYQIPVLEHIDSTEHNASHAKRNFVDYQTGPSVTELLGWCDKQVYSILNDGFESVIQEINSLPRVDQRDPIQISGDLFIEGNLHVSNLLYTNKVIDLSGRQSSFNSLFLEATSTFDRIQRTHAEIDHLRSRVDQILVDDGSVQEVYVPLRFQRLEFACSDLANANPRIQPAEANSICPRVGELGTHFVNRRNVSDIQRQALLTGRSVRVAQEVRFEHLVLRGDALILNTLNKLRIDDVIFGKGRRPIGPIYGHKEFQGGLFSTANLIVDNWSGSRIDRQTTLTSTGEQRIEANLRFSEVVLDSQVFNGDSSNYSVDGSRIEILNGLHLDSHLNQIAQVDDDNKFELPISFDELVVNGPAFFGPGTQLSGSDLESLWASVLFGHSNQNVTAPMEFRNVLVSYGGDIQVDGTINGLILTPNNVMMRDRSYNLPNPFVFESDLSVRLLQVEKALNGIQVFINPETNQYELAILYDGGRQIITGDKILNEVHLGGYSSINGLINGHLNLTQLNSLTRNDGEPFKFKHIHIRRPQLRVANNVHVHIGSRINGVPANDICGFANSLVLDQMKQRSYERLRFDRQRVVFKQIRCASINGYNNLGNHFLLRHANQRVAGTLRLVNGATFNSTINIVATFNNLNIGTLARSIFQIFNESRTGHKDFYQDLDIDSLTAHSINDLQLSKVFLAKSDLPQIITAPMSFDHLDIENVLVVGQELTTHSFNKLNVSDIITNTLQYDAPQVIYSHVELNNLHVMPGSNFYTKSLNGHDLKRLYSDAVLLDVPQQILAPKTFIGRTELTNRVALRFGLNGLSEGELKFNLLLQSDELIEDDMEFDNDVTIMKSLEIQTGQINDADVNLFVNSMLYENRPNGLRVIGNSSLRFQDVKLNDLVVTGTIQGVDLSRDAIQKSDNSNGSYDSLLRQEQIMRHNQQFLNRLYNSGSTFSVRTRLQNESLSGSCQIHSCPQTTPLITLPPPDPNRNISFTQPLPMVTPPNAQPYIRPAPLPPVPWTVPRPPPTPMPQQRPQVLQQPLAFQPPLPQYMNPGLRPFKIQNYHLPFAPIMPRPDGVVNMSLIPQRWKPIEPTRWSPIPLNDTHLNYHEAFPLIDPRYLEHQANLKAHAIQDLAMRVNRFLSVSFYYEILQNHPELGPVLNAVESPIPSEQGYAMLLLKAASKKGEPCLSQNQSIVVTSPERIKGRVTKFKVSSHIQDTSSPSLVESVVIEDRKHYLFVADLRPRRDTMSRILIYLWNHHSGMYDPFDKILIEGNPSAMKAFVVDGQLACLAIANPRVVQSTNTGAPLLYCQRSANGKFEWRFAVNMTDIFDLDVISLPSSRFGAGRSGSYIMMAGLRQHDTGQVGDLIVTRIEVRTGHFTNLITRRIARPLKLHFVTQSARTIHTMYDLVVSEGITSNDGVQATTRIFSVGADGRLIRVQTIRDNQFTDIQSVLLNDQSAMIFMRSTHSISIYAPLSSDVQDPRCQLDQFRLVQRLPTKGASKFLVFNSLTSSPGPGSANTTRVPFGHFLVLSRDECEHQQYRTIILKPKFR